MKDRAGPTGYNLLGDAALREIDRERPDRYVTGLGVPRRDASTSTISDNSSSPKRPWSISRAASLLPNIPAAPVITIRTRPRIDAHARAADWVVELLANAKQLIGDSLQHSAAWIQARVASARSCSTFAAVKGPGTAQGSHSAKRRSGVGVDILAARG